MQKRFRFSIIAMIFMLFILGSVQVSAKTGFYKNANGIRYYNTYGNLVKGTWFKDGSTFYYAKKTGYLATEPTEINGQLYYFAADGKNKTGWRTINNQKYYFMSKTREAIRGKMYTFVSGKTYLFAEDGHMLKNWQKVNGKYYYFKNDMKIGWLTIKDNTYYLYKTGENKGRRASGLSTIGGKKYYFDPKTGVLWKSTTVNVGNVTYKIDAKGVCTVKVTPVSSGPSPEMLFFLTFESGSQAYDQTGGDSGNACGAYQFDYRYSLLPLVQYVYKKNPTLCAEFEAYAKLKTGKTLKSNKKFYKAWHTIYKRNPKKFSSLQDTFAMNNYYTPCENSLIVKGINITKRPDVVKGAVYSYSIQHGAATAAAAVKAAGIKNSTPDREFLKKLYAYRMKKFKAYKTRYTAEYKKALTYLPL